MRNTRRWVAAASLAACATAAGCGGGGAGNAPVKVSFSAVEIGGLVRYSVALTRPSGATFSDVRVEVTLPPGAAFVEAMETPDRTVFLGRTGDTLAWAAPFLDEGEVVDAFAFRLSQPLPGPVAAQVSGEGELYPLDIGIGDLLPDPVPATTTADDIPAGSAGTGGDFVPVGTTGVFVSIETGVVPDGTLLHVTRPGPETNPPSPPGAPWWCAACGIDDLPTGATVDVMLPARQAMPAGLLVDLFTEVAGDWVELPEKGFVTDDGQFVRFEHPGGLVVAGTDPAYRPTVGVASGAPRLVAAIAGTAEARSFTSTLHTIVVENTGSGPAIDVLVSIEETAGPIDFLFLTSEEGAAAIDEPSSSPGPARAHVSIPMLAAGTSAVIRLYGRTGVVSQAGTATIHVVAADHLGGPAVTTLDSADLDVVVSPP